MTYGRVSTALFFLLVVSFSLLVISEPTPEEIDRFVQWAIDYDIQWKFNLLKEEGAGIGGYARVPVKQGDTIVEVPKNVIVSNKRAKSQIGSHFSIEWPSILENEALQVWLIREKSLKKGYWGPYIDVLPKVEDFASHPNYWTEEDFAFSKGTLLQLHTNQIKAAIKQSYDLLAPQLTNRPDIFTNPDDFNYDNFLWAHTIISSRTWSSGDDIILVPMADMLNHVPNWGMGHGTDQEFVIKTAFDVAVGEPIYDNYGPKSNFELLTGYGFFLENNPYSALRIFIASTNTIEYSLLKPYFQDTTQLKIYKGKLSDELLRLFRASTLAFSELTELDTVLSNKPVSLENELKTYRATIAALNTLLAGYGTAEDDEVLRKKATKPHHHFGIKLREDERAILKEHIGYIRAMWNEILNTGTLPGGVSV